MIPATREALVLGVALAVGALVAVLSPLVAGPRRLPPDDDELEAMIRAAAAETAPDPAAAPTAPPD
ncbi:MAG: hypothetical protein MUE41_12745 [Gemmatimonadaceae bacterium]|jgi:hypothetical protein|nr:hypothetical protein [Gemmatimonadaceae bacterium]